MCCSEEEHSDSSLGLPVPLYHCLPVCAGPAHRALLEHPRVWQWKQYSSEMLEKLRAGFVSADVIIIFTLGVKVLNGTNDSCPDGDMSYPALCCGSNNKCTLCSDLPSLASQLKLVDDEVHVKFLLAWMSFLHGSASSVFLFNFYDRVDIRVLLFNMDLTFEIDRLECNPSVEMMICALSELLSWVSECES